MENILWFREIYNTDIGKVGGKGASLGEMYNADIPVPPGYCVTAQAFGYFLEVTGLRDRIAKTLQGLDINNTPVLEQKAKDVRDMILLARMPDEIRKDIEEAYSNLNVDENIVKHGNKNAMDIIKTGRDNPYVAVRSSATAEDLPSISKDEHILVKINNKTYFRRMEEIYDLVGEGLEFDIEIPAMKDKKVQWVKVSNLYKHPVKNGEKLYKIITETGREIIVSPNHTLIVLDESKLEPKEVKSIYELKGNERLPAINNLPIIDLNQKEINVLDYVKGKDIIEENNIIKIKNNSSNWKIQYGLSKNLELTRDFLYFLGVYCAEGSTYGFNEIIVTNSDKDIMKRVINYVSSLRLYNNQVLNKHSLRFYNKTLVRFLHETTGKPILGVKGKGKTCKVKRVPEFIFGCNKDLIGEFLSGCFDGDGYCGKETLEYCSVSKDLTSGIIKLLEMLNIEWFLREKNNAFIITIKPCSFTEFSKCVGFEDKEKQKRLDNLIKSFNDRTNHPEFLNNITGSLELAKTIRGKFEDFLNKEEIMEGYCPLCDNKINLSSNYKEQKRYYCENCHKSFYENNVIKKLVNKYVNYDSNGRFLKESIPWNKASFSKNMGVKQFKKLMKERDISFDSLHDSVKWDKIKEIKEIDYNDFVYDFSVPDVQNFAAGIGGIITHNSFSFAGQQETFLNVKGAKQLIISVQKCWASLFTGRAVYYRTKNDFDHMKVLISVVVQKMVNSTASGIMFTINPSTNVENEIVIEAGFGLGEAIVSGSVNPDNYIVDKKSLEIIHKKVNKQDWKLIRDDSFEKNVKVDLKSSEANLQKMIDRDIINLAKLGVEIENHYNKPMDIEFALEGSRIYIVQARPVTTLHKEKPFENNSNTGEETKSTGKVLCKGLGASPGIRTGKVKIVHDINELDKVEKGDILVTEMTNPDYVVAMERAAAVVTDEGGSTAHASIVSRELGIPAVVGTETATHVLKDGMIITVDGSKGEVYEGSVSFEKETLQEKKTEISYQEEETSTRVKVICDLPTQAERAGAMDADGVGLVRIEFIIAENGIHPAYYIKMNREDEYEQILYDGLKRIASNFVGKPIWVRTSDIRTDEYRNLTGGDEEPHEANPMIGWHGIRRGLDDFKILETEFRAIKKLHDEGYNNVGVMIPFVISVEEIRKSKEIMRKVGLEPIHDLDFGVMVETPAAVWIIDKLCEEGISFISFGTNDLTQTTLGIDRGNDRIQKDYSELHLAVLRSIEHVIKTCKKYNVETSICGQAGSNPEMVKHLVHYGIDSISANIDAVHLVRKVVAREERRLLLEAARMNIKS